MEENKKQFILKVYRGTPERQYWEEFELRRYPGQNIISSLLEIQKNPVNREGEMVTPVVWESSCLEEVCGSCSMLIDGIPRQACSAIVEVILAQSKKNVITLAPFSKFPLVKDLVVDRQKMFENLKKVSGWVPVDALFANEYGERIPQKKQEAMYIESTCMTCACCLEACPQVNERSKFIGPAAINQVKRFNSDPIGKQFHRKRTLALMGEGGIQDCGNAQNCVKVCPKKIPLTQSIAHQGRNVSRQLFREMFSLIEEDTES